MKLGLMMKKAKSLEKEVKELTSAAAKKDPPLVPPLPIKKLKIKFGPDGHDVTVSGKAENETETERKAEPALPEAKSAEPDAELEEKPPVVEKISEAKEATAAAAEDEESKREQSAAASVPEAANAATVADEAAAGSEKKPSSSPSSPLKKGSRIDFLAKKLEAMKQASPPKQTPSPAPNMSATMPASIHDAIFGPSVPVNMSKSVAASETGSSSAAEPLAAKDDNNKSEIERMQEEIDRMNSDPPKESFKDPRKKALKYLKGSVDRQQTTTPPMPPANLDPTPAAPSMGMKNFKKALLNKFSGGDIYPAVNNGPSAASMAPPPAALPSVPVPPSVPEPTPTVTWRKAVDSVTSVPTRADYQWQLEEHQERKRKRDKVEGISQPPKASEKGGKKKKGRKGDKEDA